MKGFAHFITGLAATSMFPFAVRAAAEGNPAYFILGGIFGLLPDTLDFKVFRYLYRHDMNLMADARSPDPQRLASEIAGAVVAASYDPAGKRIKLNTVQCGADRWLRYSVDFNDGAAEIRVRMGPIVDTGQNPLSGDSGDCITEGRASVPVPMALDYAGPITVDIFDGPSLMLKAQQDGRVTINFLPWHRSWTHSFLTGAFFAVSCWFCWTALNLQMSGWGGVVEGWKPAAIVMSAYSSHIVCDQLGVMGSDLFFPITRKRIKGLGLMHSTDALPNFHAVWCGAVLIYCNLYRDAFSFTAKDFSYALLFLLLPLAVHALLRKGLRAFNA